MGEKLFYLQFAGQGMKYIDELRKLHNGYRSLRPFIHEAVAALRSQLLECDDGREGYFSKGLDVDRWIEEPETTPDFAYLLSSPVSHCLIYLTQISHYLALLEEGIEHRELQKLVHSVSGFSTGIMASVLTALDLSKNDLWKRAIDMQKMFFWQGLRCQESMDKLAVRLELDEELHNTAEGSPSCMASVAKIPCSKLEAALSDFEEKSSVYLAYKLTPLRSIVSGRPEALRGFRDLLLSREPKAQWRYVPSTIAAHSPFLAHAFETTPEDARRVGLSLSGEEMVRPVLASNGKGDLRESEDIVSDIMHAYFLETGHWRAQIEPLFKEEGITEVLDFGPGSGVAGLSEMMLARKGTKVRRCSIAFERKMLVQELS